MYRTLGFHRTVAKLSKISVNASSNSDLVFTSTRTLSISSSKFSDIRLKDSTTSLTSNGISEDTFTTILGEPTFYSQGLGWPQNIYPPGVVQSLLETIHLTRNGSKRWFSNMADVTLENASSEAASFKTRIWLCATLWEQGFTCALGSTMQRMENLTHSILT